MNRTQCVDWRKCGNETFGHLNAEETELQKGYLFIKACCLQQ